ncbi:hypothetical protein [Planomonospora venezuelensis]|uniref:Uncharacterized protein n=1 Tax=Planomonospora venezuelensis TaxID=1999 RepID=A0A841D1H4_PLAVE|nr:hypothetical protein [Planomonospora venezuelensis]MBB5963590.1 hypothetical protein [Planomonospora venezuelensis]GIN01378.1 hypothetical protein Pve01_30360 [Planomonospora venezuelensis]
MRKLFKTLVRCAGAAALAASVSVVAASPASATTARCTVVTNHCETAILKATYPLWFIDWEVDSGASGYGCSWRVRDTDNQNIVGSGRLGAFRHHSGRITGLYGYYRLELFNCGTSAFGWLDDQWV